MRPSLPADVLARAHEHARATIRQARPFLIAGLVLTGAGLTMSEFDLFFRAGLVAWGGMFAGIAWLARYRAFRVLRSNLSSSARELQVLGVPQGVLSGIDLSAPSRVVASVPPEALALLAQMKVEGRDKKFRLLSSDEKYELRLRSKGDSVNAALISVLGVTVLLALALAGVADHWMTGSVVGVGMYLQSKWQAVKAKQNDSIRVVLYPNNSNPGVEWAEYLGKSDEVWTINGEPAEWRLK